MGVLPATAVKSVAGGEEKKKQEGEGFFESEDDGKVGGRGVDTDSPQKVVDVAGGDSRKDLGDADEVFRKGEEEG